MVDYAGNLGRELQLVGTWNGKPLEAGFKSTAQKVTAASKQMSNKTAGLVNDKMGRAMGAFNEKTEKGRQLLTTFGGAVGGAAGNVVYYAGTLTYVIGRFKLWELALMAVLAGLAALVWAITKETESEKIWNATIEANVASMDALHESTKEFLKSQKQLNEGWSQYETRAKAVTEEINVHHDALKRVMADIEKWEDEAPAIDVLEKRYPTEMINAFAISLREMGRGYQDNKALLDAHAVSVEKNMNKEIEAEKEKDKKKKGKRKDADTDTMGAVLQDFDKAEQAAIELAGREAEAYAKEMERQGWEIADIRQGQRDREEKLQEEHMWRLIALKEREEEAKQDLEKETREANEAARNETMMNAIGLFDEMGSLMAANEEQRTAVKIIAIMAEAAWQMQMEIAKGVAAINEPWVAAAHFSAAALFGAIAAGNVASASSGGGASSSGRASIYDRVASGGREPGATTINLTITDSVLTGSEAGREIVNKIDEWWNRVDPGRATGRVS